MRVPRRLQRSCFGRVWAAALLMMGAAGSITGCKVGPKYVKPTVATYQAPNAYDDAWKENDPDWKPASPQDAALRGDWWSIFHDPELGLLEVRAGIQNQQIKAYAARFLEARAQIGINNADRFPTVGIDPFVNALRYSDTREYFNPPPDNTALAALNLPLTINWEVDLFGRIRRTIDVAKEESQATAADLENVQLSIQSDLAMDYFEARAADAQIQLLQATVSDYQDALRITTNRFEGGITNESDVFQAKTQLQSAIVQLQDIAVSRASLEHAIAILIGQPPNSFTLPAEPINAAPPYIPAGIPSELLERRPDIAAAERRTHEANEQIGIARAAFFPTLTFSGSGGLESAALVNLFKASNIDFALGPALDQTIYDAGRRKAVYSQVLSAFDETSADYKQTVLTAFQQVEDNLAALRILEQEAKQQQAATQAAQGAQRIFNNRYIGGLDTYLQVVTAQQTALSNERNDIDILRRRMDASVLLIKALGGGWSTANLPPG